MIPPTHPRNIDSASHDAAELSLSHTCWAPHIALPSTWFRSGLPPSSHSNSFNRSDPPPPDHEKTDEKPVGQFLWYNIRRRMNIKHFLPKQVSLCEYTWEVIACMVITGKGRSGPDMWPKTPNQGTGTENMILTKWYEEVIKRTNINPQ